MLMRFHMLWRPGRRDGAGWRDQLHLPVIGWDGLRLELCSAVIECWESGLSNIDLGTTQHGDSL